MAFRCFVEFKDVNECKVELLELTASDEAALEESVERKKDELNVTWNDRITHYVIYPERLEILEE